LYDANTKEIYVMSLTIEFPDDVIARVRARATRGGRGVNAVIAQLIEEALDADVLTEAEQAEIAAAVDRGDADFAAGRRSTSEEFYAQMRSKHGVL
jgi:predicted transcriptional regulator